VAQTYRRNDGLRKHCTCGPRKWPKCDHPWHFNFRHRGIDYRFSLDKHLGRRIKSKTEAETEAERIRLSIKDGNFGSKPEAPIEHRPPDWPTFVVVAEQYEERHAKPALCKRAVAQHGYARSFLSSVMVPTADGESIPFTSKPFRALTADDIQRALQAKAAPTIAKVKAGKKKEYKRRVGGKVAANRLRAYLRSLWNWAIAWDYAEQSPFVKLNRMTKKNAEVNRSRRFEGDEEKRLRAAAGPHLNDMIDAALETGCRSGELHSMQWYQVRWEPKPEIVLPSSKTKTRKERYIPISSRLRQILERRQFGPDGRKLGAFAYVFGNEVGERVGSVKTAWRAACTRAGIVNLRFHDLRHEAGSRKLEQGYQLHDVAEWLGHNNVTTTSRYLNAGRMRLHELNERSPLSSVKA
jgi:integrase